MRSMSVVSAQTFLEETETDKCDERKLSNMEEAVVGSACGELFQDQILILPEIMRRILKQLDFRSLMNCRLVCKSWVPEVQSHLVGRTVVRFLKRRSCTVRLKAFIKETRQKKLLRSFPQPVHALDVNMFVWTASKRVIPYKPFLRQLLGICPPLALTRFSPGDVPMKLALPVIIHCSASLEYLKLHADTCEVGYLPPKLKPRPNFPKLRHVSTDIAAKLWSVNEMYADANGNHFPSVVAWIVNESPHLETWESQWSIAAVELASQLVLKLNIENLRTLSLANYNLTRAAAEQFLSIPFSRLEHLKLHNIWNQVPCLGWGYYALEGTVKKSAGTLKTLDFDVSLPDGLHTVTEFPICSKVEELTLDDRHNWNGCKSVISKLFPSLQLLNGRRVHVDSVGELQSGVQPVF